jgi:hypothetical protein
MVKYLAYQSLKRLMLASKRLKPCQNGIIRSLCHAIPGKTLLNKCAVRFRIFVGIFAIVSAHYADGDCLTGGRRDGRAEVRFFAK